MSIREDDGKPPLSKRQIVSEVSKHSKVKKDIVELVISSYHDVMMEEIANRGKFRIPSIVSIYTVDRKASKTPLGEFGETTYLVSKMSKVVKDLFKRKSHYPQANITRSNWTEHIKNIREHGVHGDLEEKRKNGTNIPYSALVKRDDD